MRIPHCPQLLLVAFIITCTTTTTTNAFVSPSRAMPRASPTPKGRVVGYRITRNDPEMLDPLTIADYNQNNLFSEERIFNGEERFFNGEERNGKSTTVELPPVLTEQPQRVVSTETAVRGDLSQVEFVPSEIFNEEVQTMEEVVHQAQEDHDSYPFAAMLTGSAPYIATHAGETAVIYLPGEWLNKEHRLFDSIMTDLALCWLMGLQLVVVADVSYEPTNDSANFQHAHEAYNALHATSKEQLRHIEEAAGFVRVEIERKLNKCLRLHGVTQMPEGNVVGGNFYSAKPLGVVRGHDLKHTGVVKTVHAEHIQSILDHHDVVLLTTVASSTSGDSACVVNGHHLAAQVAASLDAYKLIYLANEGSVLSKAGEEDRTFFQEIPLSFAKDVCEYHKVHVHDTNGFATFAKARQELEPRAVELLLKMGWSNWALEQGVTRAHIVNPRDGALLEELFTSKNGANTCLYHDDENLGVGEDDETSEQVWDDFFAAEEAQGGFY